MPLKAVNFIQAGVMLGLFVLTLSVAHLPGTGDMDYWERWAHHAEIYGLVKGYAANKDNYPPYSSVILWVAFRASRLFGGDTFSAIKAALLVFLCLTSLLFWLWTRNFWLAAALHLSLLLGSVALGYIDIFFAPSLLLSLWALKERKLVWFAIFYSLTCLIKWQPITIAPFILLYLLDLKRLGDWKQIDFPPLVWQVGLPASLLLTLTLAGFGVRPVLGSLRLALSHNFLSGNALNFNWIMTHFLHVFDPKHFGPLINGQARFIRTRSLEITLVPRLLFLLSYTLTWLAFFRRDKTFEAWLLFGLLGYGAYFIFNIGVHENHLFLAVLFATVLAWQNRRYLFLMLGVMVMSNLNLILFYGLDGSGLNFSRVIAGIVDSALLFSIFNVGGYVTLWWMNVLNKTPQAIHPLPADARRAA